MNIAEKLQVQYTERQIRLDDIARRDLAKGEALTARIHRNFARIAYRAAKAEVDDPEPGPRPCSLCKGVRTCDIKAHRARGWT